MVRRLIKEDHFILVILEEVHIEIPADVATVLVHIFAFLTKWNKNKRKYSITNSIVLAEIFQIHPSGRKL